MYLLLVFGCTPCPATVTDPEARLETSALGTLEATYTEWVGWVGEGRVCVDTITVGEPAVEGAPGSWSVSVASAEPTALREQLCTALDGEEDLASRLAEDGTFVAACGEGPPFVGWVDAHAAACGEAEVDELDALLLDVVYPNWSPRSVNTLTTEMGAETARVPIVEQYDFVSAGDAIVIHERDQDETRIAVIDPATGVRTDVVTEPYQSSTLLAGGDAAVFIRLADLDAAVLTTIDPVTLVTAERTVELGVWPSEVVVSEGVLYAASSHENEAPIIAIDLATGARSEIAVPAANDPWSMIVSQLTAVPGGVLARLIEGDVQVDYDLVSTMVNRDLSATWSGGAWTEWPSDIVAAPIGATADGAVIGTFRPYPNDAFGVYEPSTDTLSLSDTLCPDLGDRPVLLAGGVPYGLANTGEELVFTAWVFGG